MAQKHRFHNQKRNKSRPVVSRTATPMAAPKPLERKPPVVYGEPFILLEDEQKKTFEYKAGAWVPHTMTIAECRVTCQVKELPQKVNRMTRYEIRCPTTHP